MNPDFATIDALKAEWDALQPLSPENEARLWKKLRLEWNYNSNHIEGNTLTYGETELLLLHDHTSGNHQLREYEEMKAHDLGIAHVRALAADDRPLSEGDIRDLNKIILKEPFWKDAITVDGQETRKRIVPGDYKTMPNNVRTATGEIFQFASPVETPERMRALVEWIREEMLARNLHPLEFISKLHHDFVLIHPFDDGNGRVARLLINYVLFRFGYPPLIVKSADKSGYLTALRQADTGNLAALTTYLARQMEWSLSVGVRAAKGESIEELSDTEKELALFIRDQQQHRDRVKRRSLELIKELYEIGWKQLFEKFEAKISKLYPLFTVNAPFADTNVGHGGENWRSVFEGAMSDASVSQMQLLVRLQGYRGRASTPFNLQAELNLNFDDFEYRIWAVGREVAKKLYSEPVLSEEAEAIASDALKTLFDQIKVLSETA